MNLVRTSTKRQKNVKKNQLEPKNTITKMKTQELEHNIEAISQKVEQKQSKK